MLHPRSPCTAFPPLSDPFLSNILSATPHVTVFKTIFFFQISLEQHPLYSKHICCVPGVVVEREHCSGKQKDSPVLTPDYNLATLNCNFDNRVEVNASIAQQGRGQLCSFFSSNHVSETKSCENPLQSHIQ